MNLPVRGSEGVGQKEVEFYQTVAPEMASPPLIRCYDARFSKETGRSHILMDDLSETHSQPEENCAPSEKLSRLAVEALAKAHAAWWNSPKLGNGIGEVFSQKWLHGFIEHLEVSVTEFVQSAGGLSSKQKDAYAQMLSSAERIWGRLTDPRGLAVAHGDMHWWNFLLPNDPARDAVHIFDWHLWHIDLGARDLAFLLALGGFAEPRPEIETELLHAYHDALPASGVTNYSWETFFEDYRWSAIRNLNVAVIFRSQGKHESTWQNALRRSFESFERLNCSDLIA